MEHEFSMERDGRHHPPQWPTIPCNEVQDSPTVKGKGRHHGGPLSLGWSSVYRVDSISKPHASSRGSGMYLEFLFRRAHSRKRVDRKYWSGESLYSRTTCSNSVIVGVIGPMGSGLPLFGFPRRFAMNNCLSTRGNYELQNPCLTIRFFGAAGGFLEKH